MKGKKGKTGIISIGLFSIALLFLWSTGLIGLWINGMAYIAYNTEKFTDTKGHVLPEEYSISINLDDLQSNIGKELYNDGTNKIYINCINNTGSSNSGGYYIGFRSSGQYSLTNAALVSGIHHATEGEHSFTINMSAKMTAKYKDKVYDCREAGTSALNYRNGDDFSFYFFPNASHKRGNISFYSKIKGEALLTVSNLYKNIWSEKE